MKQNRPDYANWIPRKLLTISGVGGSVLVASFALSFFLSDNMFTTALRILLTTGALVLLTFFGYMARARVLLSYEGGGVQGKILDNVLHYLDWDGNGSLLDIGCGSGALAIKAAKKFKNAQVVGVDYWGAEWDYSQSQCERNACLEGVADRTSFQEGDAARLNFSDGQFDAAVSNFVFHEVRIQPDKTALIREALRVLKTGAPFAFEDVYFSKKFYPGLNAMLEALSAEVGELHFADTRQNDFVPPFLRTPLIAGEMGLIYGKK